MKRRPLRLEGKGKKGSTHLHKGKAFEAHGEGGNLFLKDVATAGRRIHPGTHEVIDLPRDRLVQFANDANRWRAAGNKIPFPDGHDESTAANLGFWPGPFFVVEDTLYGIVEPLDELAKKKISDGTLDGVSLATELDLKDQSGADYEETIVHIAATNYPVIENQGAFVALSKTLDSESRRCFVPEALALSFKGGDEMDREKLIKMLKLAKDATDEEIIVAMQKRSVEQGADFDKKIEASRKKTLEGLALAMEKQGFKLTIDGESIVKIEKAEEGPEETEAEKEAKKRLDVLESRESKMVLEQAAAKVDAAIKSGQLPPGEKERVEKLLSIKEKAMGLMLSGSDPVATAIDVVAEVGKLLEALPKKVDGSKLKTFETIKDVEETDALKNAKTRMKAAVERRTGKKPEAVTAAK